MFRSMVTKAVFCLAVAAAVAFTHTRIVVVVPSWVLVSSFAFAGVAQGAATLHRGLLGFGKAGTAVMVAISYVLAVTLLVGWYDGSIIGPLGSVLFAYIGTDAVWLIKEPAWNPTTEKR